MMVMRGQVTMSVVAEPILTKSNQVNPRKELDVWRTLPGPRGSMTSDT